jgi:hypothetical protein
MCLRSGYALPASHPKAAIPDKKRTGREPLIIRGELFRQTEPALYRSERGGFDYSNTEIPRQVFHPGPTGGEDIRAYLKAVGNERGVSAISDAAALALRDKAAGPDRVLDPKKIDVFLKDHQEALAELPAGFRDRFATPV